MARPKGQRTNNTDDDSSNKNASRRPNDSRLIPSTTSSYTISELRSDTELRYKICVLIYDLLHMTKDRSCENRTQRTTDALYISAPCFTDEEASLVKGTKVSPGTTFEAAISKSRENFFQKRKASADCRPCGPHDMVSVYLSCFGIEKAEIEDPKFVSRLRRSGLGGC